jgi:hypothetical protein
MTIKRFLRGGYSCNAQLRNNITFCAIAVFITCISAKEILVDIDRFSTVDLLAPPVSNITDRKREKNEQCSPEVLRELYTGVAISLDIFVSTVTKTNEKSRGLTPGTCKGMFCSLHDLVRYVLQKMPQG